MAGLRKRRRIRDPMLATSPDDRGLGCYPIITPLVTLSAMSPLSLLMILALSVAPCFLMSSAFMQTNSRVAFSDIKQCRHSSLRRGQLPFLNVITDPTDTATNEINGLDNKEDAGVGPAAADGANDEASESTDYFLQTEDFAVFRMPNNEEFSLMGGDADLSIIPREELLDNASSHIELKESSVIEEEEEEEAEGESFFDVGNLNLPQIHLPPRLVPGVAWQHHHQSTLRLVRQHRAQQHLREKRQKQIEAEKAEQQQQQPNDGEGSNPLSNIWASMMKRSPLVSATEEWKQLRKHADEGISITHLRDLLQDEERCDAMYAVHDGVYLDYSRQRATLETMDLLFELAEKQNLKGQIDAMVNGEKINFTEERAVLHTALRADKSLAGTVMTDGVDAIKEVHEVLDQVKSFTNDVRSGKIRGYTGKRLRNIVSVGIGGSYLGPEFLHECLKTEPEGVNSALGYSLRFLSNVDPVDVERTCADLDPEETLVVIVSKTFTTAETMLNARTMRQWLWDFMGNDKEVVRKHMVACSSISAVDKVEEFGIDTDDYFFRFWDWVGGRYSVCSAAGAVPISLLYGYDLFEKFLEGARSMDEHFVSAPFHKNIPVLMGLLGVWNMSFLKYNSRTTLPYAEALLKLPAHIQQLDMESNGKRMTKHGVEVDYPVGEIDFGEAGTNGQHSFYQLLHMGQTVPCDFIGFAKSQHDFCLDGEAMSSHDELMANFFAQPDALANGKTADQVRAECVPEALVAHKVFKGNRPSLSLMLPKLTAYACGQLLAIYEHRTAVQGFMWDINSFDQWGVELGKKLAMDVKSHMLDSRRNDGKPVEETDNPATTRMLNYYLDNSRNTCHELAEQQQSHSLTRVTRKTHREHQYPPPLQHDLGVHGTKLS